MPAYVNVADAVKIAAFVFVFVKGANAILDKIGMGQFKA